MMGKRESVVMLLVVGGVAGVGRVGAQEPMPTPTLHFDGDEVTLTTPAKQGRNLVEVYIGSEGPFDFFIDTGSGISVIDAGIATRLGLDSIGAMAVGAPGGGTVDAALVRVPVLRVGDLEIRGSTPLTLELLDLSGGLMDGILGMELFQEVLLTLEPSQQRAIVSRGRLDPDGPGVIRLDQSMGHLGFEFDVAGRKVPAHIDSGSPGTFTLPLELIDELPMRDAPERRAAAELVGSSREIRSRQIDGAIRFAGLEYTDPWAGFMDPSLPTANVGAGILDRLVTTIDQAHGLLSFNEAADPPSASAAPRRLGVRLGGGPGATPSSVSSVDPGSLGERAGLHPGDRIVTLNGRPMSDYDLPALGALFGGSEPLAFEIERAGTRLTLHIR